MTFMAIDTTTLTIAAAARALKNKEFTARELTEAVLARAKEMNPGINAYAEIFEDALSQAEVADTMIAEGKGTMLTGIPLAIKDNILIEGRIASGGSKILEHYKATYDATVIRKLKAQGAVFLGRANMDEFAMGGSGENCAWGSIKNPLDVSRVPGGSSAGSAAAVAMGGAIASLGSDTGGSIRQPASFTGLVGLKPTYGAVSRYGLMAMASSLDQIGPFSRTTEDAEILYNAIAGHDTMDSTSISEDHALRSTVPQKEKLTIGIPEAFIAHDGLDADVRESFRATMKLLESAGHTVKTINIPSIAHALAVYYVIMPAEVSSNLARYDGIRYGFSKEAQKLMEVYTQSRGEGFGKEVRRRILLGTYVLSAGYYDAYYNKAVAVRNMITEEFARAFEGVDVIATPTAPTPAFKLGEKNTDPLKMYLEDVFTVPANIAGIPGISVPAGTVERDGVPLPVGVQFVANHFHEAHLFAIGKAVEGL